MLYGGGIMAYISGITGSNAEESRTIISEFDNALAAQKKDFERGAKAWRRYFPDEYGKWDAEALKVLQEEFRHPVQFDVAGPKVDTLAGSLVADLPDPNWSPVIGQKSMLTESIAETYFLCKDLYNYDDVYLKVFRDGLVHAGDLEIYEDYKYHTPEIAMGRVLYGFLVWEPYWMSDDDRDPEVCYRVAYMNAEKLVRKYKTKTDEILAEIKKYKKDMSNYTSNIAEQQHKLMVGRVGDEFQVVEKHYIEHIQTKRLLGRQEGKQQWIPFPIDKDREYLEAFADMNGIDWTTVIEDTYDDKIHHVSTVVRELQNAVLQSGVKSKIQVNGLPFHHFTAFRHAGKNMGLVETMEGVEDTINKRESLITEMISKASGGSTIVNENLFPDPKDRQNWMKNKNKPGHAQFAPLDDVKNILQHMSPTADISGATNQLQRMYQQVLPLVSRVSDALSSVTSSTDSGILFERKFQVNMIANTLFNRNMRQFINNVAESFFYQWQITYADKQKELVFRDGKTNLTLNKNIGNTIYNDVRSVPRCRVVITENTKSQTYQMRYRSIWSEMLQSINPQVAPAHYMLALKNFFDTIQTNDEDKAESKAINEMMMMIARLELVSKATGFQTASQNNTLQGLQIDTQIQQIMSQMNQMIGQQEPPQSHMGGQPGQEKIAYPPEQQGNEAGISSPDIINSSPIEAVSGPMPTTPAATGGLGGQ
jgi:hypothetical protein